MAARAVGQRSPLAEATDRVNEQQLSTLAALVRARLGGGRRVTVLGADVTVVATPARAFRRVQVADFGPLVRRPAVLIDCWRLFERTGLAAQVEYVPLGVGPGGPSSAEGGS